MSQKPADQVRVIINMLEHNLEQLKRQLRIQAFDHLRDLEDAYGIDGTAVPRVIDREELKNGQWVAVCGEGGGWRAIQVQSNADEAWLIQDSIGAYPSDTLVLLEDTPAEEPEPVKVGDTISTEEQLEELPDEAIILDADGEARGRNWGAWYRTGESVERFSPAIMAHAPFTVLYLPEEDA